MTTILIADVTGRPRGDAVVLLSRRRRLATVLRPYREAAEISGRRFIVSVHPAGELAYIPTDATVRLRAQWRQVTVGSSDVVLITYLPLGGGSRGGGGGKALQIGLTLASIALIAIAPYAAPAIAAAATGVAVASTGAVMAVQAGLVIGGLALGYAAQASAAASKRQQQGQLYSVSGGGNLPKPGARKPLLYGRSWSAPPLSQADYYLYDGDTMVLTKRMTLGLGKFKIHRVRVGDATLWTEDAGILAPFNATAPGGLGTAIEFLYQQPSQLASGDVISSPSIGGQEMPRPGGNPARTPWFRLTPQGVTADAALLSWTYPAIYRVSSQGRQVGTVAGVVFYARRIDPATGNVIGAEFELHRSTELENTFTTTPLRRSAYVRLPQPGTTYEVCAQNAYPDPVGFEQQNRSTWDAMAAFRDDVRVRRNTTEVVVRIRAGKGLTITAYSDLMVDATRILPVWNGSAWVEQATSKAVWAYADLVRSDWGLGKPSGFDADRALHYAGELTSLDTFDGALPEVSSFWEAAGAVLNPMRADPVKVGSVHSFVRDESRDEPRHVLTRRNIVLDSSRQSYQLAAEGRGDVIVEFLRDGDPKRPDEARYSYGVPSRTPKRYKIEGIRDGVHALKVATWLAAIDVFRGAERSVVTEWDGRLIYPGDHVLSDVWFLKGKQVYGVASANGRILRLDVRPSLSPDWGYGSIRTRVGREWGILRMRGAGAGLLELHPDDVAALERRSGLALSDVLARETQDPTTVVLGDLVELQETYLVRSAIPTDGDHVQIDMVCDDPRVWQLLNEDVLGPLPVDTDSLAEPVIPEISVLHARCMRIETGIEVAWGVSTTRGGRNYEADMSYDGGLSWEALSLFGPASSGRAPMRQSDKPVTVRARAYGRTGLHGAWITATFLTVAPVVAGELVDITSLPPITYENLDTKIQARIDSIDSVRTRAEGAYDEALGALTRADGALAAADAAQAGATRALADAQSAYQAAVDRSALALSTALARLDGFRRALAVDPAVRQGYIDPLVTDVRADLDILMRNATRNMQDIAGLRDALTTAGLEIIEGEGRVRFYAIEALQTAVGQTISNFSITVDALSKKIDLYGSVQGNDLQGLINSINTVQTTLDAQAAKISSLASSAQFTALGARLATAEQTISAQDAAINARATQATVDAQGLRITSAEQRISASEGRISQQVLATQSAGIDAELLPRTLAGFVDLVGRQQGAFSQSMALASEAISASVDAAGRATAELRAELLVYQGGAAAQFLSVTQAVADANSAQVTATTSLLARVNASDAAMIDERIVRAAADAATTSQITSAVSRLGAAEAGLTSEQQTRAAADAASTLRIDGAISRITVSEGRIGTAEANIATESRTRADADGAQTSRIDGAVSRITATEGRIGAAEAGLFTEQQTRAAADAASTLRVDGAYSRITAAEGRLGTVEASQVSEARTRADLDQALTYRVDVAVSRIGAAEAAITSETQTRAAADTATTNGLNAAVSRIGGAEAAIAGEASTRAAADAAQTAVTNGALSRLGGAEASIASEAKTRADADGALSSSVSGLAARTGAAESLIATVSQARADGDGALSGRIDLVNARAGNIEASVGGETQARANADGALSSRIDQVSARAEAANAGVANEATARASADGAFAGQINDLYARSDLGTAYGLFSMQVQSAPSGVSVRLAAQASTERNGQRRNAGWYLDLLPDGNSRYVIDANMFAITANGGTTYPFTFDGYTLTIPNLRVTSTVFLPEALSKARYRYDPNASSTSIQITTRPNSKVLILARFDGSPATGKQIGTAGVLTIARDGQPFDQTFVPYYVAGNNQNTFHFPLAGVSFWVDENVGAGNHTYTCYVDNGLPGVRLVVFELSA